MIMKLIGGILLVLCGGMLGYEKLKEIKRQLAVIEGMDDCLARMECEIALCERPLPEIFENLSKRSICHCRNAFSLMSKSCDEVNAGEAWGRGIKTLGLEEETENALLSLGEVLGAMNGERQSAEIEKTRNILSLKRQREKKRIDEKGKTYPLLGFCFGGIIMILII